MNVGLTRPEKVLWIHKALQLWLVERDCVCVSLGCAESVNTLSGIMNSTTGGDFELTVEENSPMAQSLIVGPIRK